MPVDHFGFAVADFAASRRFYVAALAPLGYAIVQEGPGWAMLGRDRRPELWIGGIGTPATPFHFAFAARSRAEVHAFHAAALSAGGRDNGAPGLRPQYHAHYYGGFVLDPDGHNVEAVCHAPGDAADQKDVMA